MKSLLLMFFLSQGKATGTITGIVRYPDGLPASGIRVFAVTPGDANALEGIVQTDDSGRYRLDVPPGGYFLGAGGVEAPVYFPGTDDISVARSVAVTPNNTVEGVDFLAFVPVPVYNALILRPGSTGVLSGKIRYPDGTPAAGIVVTAVLASEFDRLQYVGDPTATKIPCFEGSMTPSPRGVVVICVEPARTDGLGRYRLEKVPPGTYYLVADFVDSPMFYPGLRSRAGATAITPLPTKTLDNLDITVPQSSMASISGRVLGDAGQPVRGATVWIRNADLTSPSGVAHAISGIDGNFAFANVPPGKYIAGARVDHTSSEILNISILDQRLEGLLLTLPLAVLSGRIRSEEGEALTNMEALGNAFATKIDQGRLGETTIIPIDEEGKFSRALEPGEYLFYLQRKMPDGYRITSMRTSYGADLLKQKLIVGQVEAITVDIQIRK